jgi:hypothetical protein
MLEYWKIGMVGKQEEHFGGPSAIIPVFQHSIIP